MAFSTHSEVGTFAALSGVLAPLGYCISQKARVLDCVRAAAENPEATTPVGTTLADYAIPALRKAAGRLGPVHPWLQDGDWSYAFRSHFDFVVHEQLEGEYPTHPLFAVEFDGAQAHATSAARRRDLAKNRLCAASGLPLVRVDETFLHRRERLSIVEWLAQLWAAYRAEMPGLLGERDAEIQAMTDEQIAEAGVGLLMEYPELDVDFIFRLQHPFPPAQQLAERLASRYGFQWSEVRVRTVDRPRWRVTRWFPASPFPNDALVERWRCELWLDGPAGQATKIRGVADVRRVTAFTRDRSLTVGMRCLLAGFRTCLPDHGRQRRVPLAKRSAPTMPSSGSSITCGETTRRVELPHTGFRPKWDELFLSRITAVIRAERGLSQREAEPLARRHIEELRTLTAFRMPRR